MSAHALLQAADIAAMAFRTEVWWRGQPVLDWDLIPSIWRSPHPAGYERTITARFLTRAPTRYGKCPARGDWPAWLFLLQHYRLPTRLLDWSESPLVAAFFAVMSHPDQPAALWAMSPQRLNENQFGIRGILTTGHSAAERMFLPPFKKDISEVPKVAAILADEVDLRMLLQHAAFTIHGTNIPLNQLEATDQCLVRFEIPAASKSPIREALFRLGVRRATIFPDLENLAIDLASHEYEAQS